LRWDESFERNQMKALRICATTLILITIAISAAFQAFTPPVIALPNTQFAVTPQTSVRNPSAVTGPKQLLVILVEFSDVKHAVDKPSIDSMIFRQMAEYYSDVSYSQIQIAGDSAGWFTLPRTMKYYGQDRVASDPGSDAHKLQLVQDAVRAAQGSVDFHDYPLVMVLHAGGGQEDSDNQPDLIWSSAVQGGLQISTSTGAIVDSAAIVPEMEADGHSPLGVYTHEFGHLLGLPDLYNENSKPDTPDTFIGRWSLMGTGLWLGEPKGSSPSELEAWSRIRLGWLTSDTIAVSSGGISAQLASLQPLEGPEGLRAVRIQATGGQYYLLEFRKKIGFDKYLPSEGLLVTKVDELRSSGYGIVQVVDANPSTPTLNDAAYGEQALFKDPQRNIYVFVLSNSTEKLSVIVANRDPTSLLLTTTQINGAETINVTYSRPITLSVTLTDQSGNGLPGFPVKLQYNDYGEWNDLTSVLTDAQGHANFNMTVDIKPGQYSVRYLFEGGKLGDHFLVGNDQVATMNVEKLPLKLELLGPGTLQAFESGTITIRAVDNSNGNLQSIPVLVWLDGVLIRNGTLTKGGLDVTVSFGFNALGAHVVRVDLGGNEYYVGATGFHQLKVLIPVWVYVAVGLAVLILSYSLYARRIRRSPTRTQVEAEPEPSRLGLRSEFSATASLVR